MELFNEYYSSEIQCLLNLFSLNRPFTWEEAEAFTLRSHVYAPFGSHRQKLREWVEQGMLREVGELLTVGGGLRFFPAPLNALEEERLGELLYSEEAKLFLSPSLRRKLCKEGKEAPQVVSRGEIAGNRRVVSSTEAEAFRTVLEAIHSGRQIAYTYRTAQSPAERSAQVSPFRLEYQVFDNRWWLISYSESEKRPIKSRMNNIRSVEILTRAAVAEENVREAILSRLSPEPLVLRISGDNTDKLKNVLERCFLSFENMQNPEAERYSEREYMLRFQFFDWDKKLIVRKLMLLGEYVTVCSPVSIIHLLTRELRMALTNQN